MQHVVPPHYCCYRYGVAGFDNLSVTVTVLVNLVKSLVSAPRLVKDDNSFFFLLHLSRVWPSSHPKKERNCSAVSKLIGDTPLAVLKYLSSSCEIEN